MKAYDEIVIKLRFKNKLKTVLVSLDKEEKIDELKAKIEEGGLVRFGTIMFWAKDFDYMEKIK